MKETFNHKLASSLIEWLNYRITTYGEGFQNVSSLLYRQNDASSPFSNIYASPYKSWVYDSCSAAQIPSGFYNSNGQFLTRESGLFFDFINGRVLSSGNWGPTLSGNFATKEYNIYFSSEEQTQFFLETAYKENIDLSYNATGTIPYDYKAPCIIVTNAFSENLPFAFGGQDNSIRLFRLYTISDNNYKQEAVNSILTDSQNMYFPLIDNADMPFTAYNDLKNGSYNYCNLQNQYGCRDVFINKVYSYKINEKTNKIRNMLLSFYEIETQVIRYPNVD